MNKIICIVGATGTGKTARALELSGEQSSILVSADSRQVYRGMDIVTGKDHPKDVTIYGIDIVSPDEPCSVAVWYDNVIPVIKRAWQSGKMPIIVGGTGLYVKAITDGIETMQVPINQKLRDNLSALSITELQEKLKTLNQSKFDEMNNSDQHNPRRVIRAIEVATYYQENQDLQKPPRNIVDSKIIGLRSPEIEIYRKIIRQRVISRISLGAIEETRSLLVKYSVDLPSMSAIGYMSIIKFLKNDCTRTEMIEDWVSGELAYAKRQMTWFRKQPVIWYDINNNKNDTDLAVGLA